MQFTTEAPSCSRGMFPRAIPCFWGLSGDQVGLPSQILAERHRKGEMRRLPEKDLQKTALYRERTLFAFEPGQDASARQDMEDFLRYAFYLPYTSEDIPVSVGRLAVRYRAAENVVYLPLAYVVLQCILRPTHDRSMTVLKEILLDGTYDQLRPLKWVRGIDCLSSLRPQVSNGPISWISMPSFFCCFGLLIAALAKAKR